MRRALTWRMLTAAIAALAVNTGCGPAPVSTPDPEADLPHGATPVYGLAPPSSQDAVDQHAPVAEAPPVDGTRVVLQPWAPKACAPFFSGDVLRRIDVEIDPAEWTKLVDEYQNFATRAAAGLPEHPYHPLISVTDGEKTSTLGQIRLRGNPHFWVKQNKMQLQISFNETNKDGRFRGLRKLVLDSAHYNASYLRDRLAMSIYRDLGLPAPCENHVRLYVNGQYYGLYGNIEKVDREFLERNFENPKRNLYKAGKELKTNEDENPDISKMTAFWAAQTVPEIDAVTDVDHLLEVLAAEAVFPDADGYWAGGWNFYLYDAKGRGLVYLPWDIDLAFDNLPAEVDPLTWHKTNDNFNGRPHVEVLLADPVTRQKFVDAVAKVRAGIDVGVLQQRIDTWAEQIREAAKDDSRAPWTYTAHRNAVKSLRAVRGGTHRLHRHLACVPPARRGLPVARRGSCA